MNNDGIKQQQNLKIN